MFLPGHVRRAGGRARLSASCRRDSYHQRNLFTPGGRDLRRESLSTLLRPRNRLMPSLWRNSFKTVFPRFDCKHGDSG